MFRRVVLHSETSALVANREVLLVWISPFMGLRSWMFNHTDQETEYMHEGEVIETGISIRSIPTKEQEKRTIRTTSLELRQYDYVRSVLASNKVVQLFRDGSTRDVAVRFRDETKDGRITGFSIELEITYVQEDVLNV